MIDLTGLYTRPAQTWGALRLVPLVRPKPIRDLRLSPLVYGDDEPSVVTLPDKTLYIAYIPHAFVASWTGDGTPAAAYGTQFEQRPAQAVPIRFRRMARRIDTNRLRFLPLHLALEGYLALHFGGPAIAWEEWTRYAVTRGLSPRAEAAYRGELIPDLEEALRVFEIHPGQCGLLLYAGDTLAAAFVVPHPEDYRILHPTLIHDLYGELVYQYARLYPARDWPLTIDETRLVSLTHLRNEVARLEREWAEFHDTVMAADLLRSPHHEQVVHRMGRYTLRRFLPSFERHRENHIGELITDESGHLAYLKTFRLSESQTRRGHLLTTLAYHDWHLPATALGISVEELGRRLERAGFGYLLRAEILGAYRKGSSRSV
ncbi:hypothetical protein GCM10010106_18390 [Thermopolyspora flexuosa]|uniref:ARG and Rhodanese-Phosphatase-superfamily-associated domain-containing protein n=1 Tax=Thermopolyspora flexuosa TaxID=103836 RepID=A0A543J426_9ACTN|nr:hypothetical protein [Thermopolyspora flexuosa]TQM77574.1 hypothetical protein FHX40_4343 [Thermopolyspora flexuosa]GGM72367.1 hypothetical protein GCM10010106_18390 [Thermopolyspora flexuosa]